MICDQSCNLAWMPILNFKYWANSSLPATTNTVIDHDCCKQITIGWNYLWESMILWSNWELLEWNKITYTWQTYIFQNKEFRYYFTPLRILHIPHTYSEWFLENEEGSFNMKSDNLQYSRPCFNILLHTQFIHFYLLF